MIPARTLLVKSVKRPILGVWRRLKYVWSLVEHLPSGR
jgi:hypothetical protein